MITIEVSTPLTDAVKLGLYYVLLILLSRRLTIDKKLVHHVGHPVYTFMKQYRCSTGADMGICEPSRAPPQLGKPSKQETISFNSSPIGIFI